MKNYSYLWKPLLLLFFSCVTSCGKAQKIITKAQALENVNEFERLIDDHSSYARTTNYDYHVALEKMRRKITAQKSDEVSVYFLTKDLSRVMAGITDRHASVRTKVASDCRNCSWRLPFVVKRLGDKLTAIKPLHKKNESPKYVFFDSKYPYLKSIYGKSIEELMFLHEDKKAPIVALLTRLAKNEMRYFAAFYYGIFKREVGRKINITLTNLKDDKILSVKFTKDRLPDKSIVAYKMRRVRKENNYGNTMTLLDGNIGYIPIPMMFKQQKYSDQIVKGIEKFLDATDALIIDIRGNIGGRRTILQAVAPYLVPPENSPWVANVAYMRSEKTQLKGEYLERMEGRFLYPYTHFNTAEKKAIDAFNAQFKTAVSFDKNLFSSPHYMVLNAGKKHYDKPVYILVNEKCFSAATVFASAFKGLPNVKIVGVTPDGSSGNSKRFYLKNSDISVKISMMISLQRNGKTLDGNGIEPDIFIDVDTAQILGQRDSQLETLKQFILSDVSSK